jgi:outer membrane autotransporter protein
MDLDMFLTRSNFIVFLIKKRNQLKIFLALWMIVILSFSTSIHAGGLSLTGESAISPKGGSKRVRTVTVVNVTKITSNVKITSEANSVKEGESVRIKVAYENLGAGTDYCLVKVDSSVSGNASLNVDYKLHTQNNPSNGDDYLIIDAISDAIVDPNESINITFTPKVVKGSCVLSSSTPVVIPVRIIDVGGSVSKNHLKVVLSDLKTEVKRGAGNTRVARIKFSLPSGKYADKNCLASTWVRVVGGTAKSGIDFKFPNDFRVNFNHVDGNSKTKDVNLNVLAGSGDKTLELEIETQSFGGSTGNSCPLAGGTHKRMTIKLKDAHLPVVPTVSISANPSSAKAGETVTVRYDFKGNTSTCSAVYPVVVGGDKNAVSVDTSINVLKQHNILVKIKPNITKETNVTLGARAVGCKLANTNTTASIHISKKNTSSKPTVSMTVVSSPIKVGKSIDIIYKISGDTTSCKVIKPVLRKGSSYAKLRNANMNLRGKKQATVIVDISRQDASKEIEVALGVETEGCNFASNPTVSFKIPKKGSTSSAKKESSETIRKSTCDVLRKIQLTSAQKSYFKAQCGGKDGNGVGAEAKNNFDAKEVSIEASAVLSAAGRQLQNVRSRLSTLRATRGKRGVDVSGATLNIQGSTVSVGLLGGAAGDDENGLLENSRWGFFANGDYAFGDENRNTGRDFDFNSTGLTFGADYRFSGDKKYAGVAIGYKDFNSDFTSQKGGTDVKGYNLNVYGTYLLSDQVYLDATIGYGKDSVNSKRPVYKDANSGKTFFATGKPDAKEFTFSVGGGYEFYKGEWSLTPYGRMDYTKATIDAYKETSDVSAQSGLFRFDKQNTKALTSTIGLKTSRSLSTSKGVFVPYASLEWKHEFKGRGAITGTHLLTGKQTPVGETSKFDRNYYNLGVGVSAQFPKGKAAFLSFESRQGDSVVKDNAVKAGFRWEF